MNDKPQPFTVADALEIQFRQLLTYSPILRPEVYAELVRLVYDATHRTLSDANHTAYDIPRGQSIDNILLQIRYRLSK